MNPAAIHPIVPFWDALDRLMLQGELRRCMDNEPGASLWPWESDNLAVQAVWEQLTRPENLAALEEWGQSIEEFNNLAFGSTAMAIETCRLRADGSGGIRAVADCTQGAAEVCRQKYARLAGFPVPWVAQQAADAKPPGADKQA